MPVLALLDSHREILEATARSRSLPVHISKQTPSSHLGTLLLRLVLHHETPFSPFTRCKLPPAPLNQVFAFTCPLTSLLLHLTFRVKPRSFLCNSSTPSRCPKAPTPRAPLFSRQRRCHHLDI
jgi:hypothetical protein